MSSELENLSHFDAKLVARENLEPYWHEKLKQSVACDNFPTHLIYPRTLKSLGEIIKYAGDRNWKVMPCGSGSKLTWGGRVAGTRLAIGTLELDRIVDHAVGDLTVTVEAGVKLADLQNTLERKGQFLPIDPAYPESATIGGIVACADTGSWRQRYGGVRDLVLGLSFVRSDGETASSGGRVVKNVAGYDLMKLFTGSYGTLGMISQVTFRVYPASEASGTVVMSGNRSAIATAAQTILGSALTPSAADLISPSLVERFELGKGMGSIVRFQSIAESVKQQSAKIASIARELGLQSSFWEGASERSLWQKLSASAVPVSTEAITCKIGMLPSAVPEILDKIEISTSKQGESIIHASTGLGRLQLTCENAVDRLIELRSLLAAHRGFLTILEAPVALKQQLDPWGYTGNALELMRELKKQFDPTNMFSPGRFVGGI